MDDIWFKAYSLLREYLKDNDGIYPTKKTIYNEIDLYWWIRFQRHKYKNGIKKSDGSIVYKKWILTRQKIKKLNEIDFMWDEPIEKKGIQKKTSWDEAYTLLKEYLELNNNKYPEEKILFKGYDIYSWIRGISNIYKNGKTTKDGSIKYRGRILSLEKQKKLNSINFPWEMKKKDKWEKKFEEFKEYLIINNGCYPPSKEELYQWVNNQRLVFKRGSIRENGDLVYKTIVLTKERMEKLYSIGFNWDNTIVDSWEKKYNLLKSYILVNGFPRTRVKHKGVMLDEWIKLQRDTLIYGSEDNAGNIRYYNNYLSVERLLKLQSIGFKWINNDEKLTKREIELLLYRYKKLLLLIDRKNNTKNNVLKKIK